MYKTERNGMMQKFTVEDILAATGGRLASGSADTVIKGVATDSRDVQEGYLFVAIKGARVDGHTFFDDVFKKGAAAVLSEQDYESESGAVVRVESTVKALGDAAAAYLKKYRVPVVAVTGSIGKTSTKDMVWAVLSSKYNVLKTGGNRNSEVGLPLTVFELEAEHEAAVLEMGMEQFGEIHRLVEIARPEAAVITNIAMSHIENLGSQEGILKAKLEVTDFFGEKNTLFVNGDDKFLKGVSGGFMIKRYGTGEENDLRAEDISDKGLLGSEFTAVCRAERCRVRVKAPGVHNVYNALAAIGVGMNFGISFEDAAKAVEDAVITDMRLAVEEVGGMTIIKDYYNAGPMSVAASLKVLAGVRGGRRIAVLGDMLELGDFSESEHRKIGVLAAECADMLITAGMEAKLIAEAAHTAGLSEVLAFPNTDAAAYEIGEYLKAGDCVLIKASRGMKFEKIYEAIKEKN